MAKEIAVFLGKEGLTVPLNETGKVVLFRKNEGKWQVAKEMILSLESANGLQALRKAIQDLLTFLEDCKVFAALSVTGMPYYELEKGGCSVWEVEGKPPEFLDYIQKQEEEAVHQKVEEVPEEIGPVPVEGCEGCYYISLTEIQGNKGITSKQALIPFLTQKQFASLEVECKHIPPWLETFAADKKLDTKIEKYGIDEIKLTIMPQG